MDPATEHDPNATVVVDVTTDGPTEDTTDDGGTVVIVEGDTGTDTGTVTTDELDRWVNMERRINDLDQRITDLSSTAYGAAATADEALDVANDAGEHADAAADEAVEVAVTAVEDGEVVKDEDGDTVVEADTTPGRSEHWLYRSFGDWRHGR